jgi:histidyl-tRNA synthetase
MASQKPSIPQGTRDFSTEEMVRRNYLFDTIKSVFKKYGYLPIETPAMEKIETLMGKYGDEGDKLVYKIRSNRNLLEHYPKLKECECLKAEYDFDWIPMASDKALRYDLTVPFARYVVQHQNELTFPFKRSQIQPVWRGDKPQKGRYREFYQCDADVIGSNSLLNEVELVQMTDEIFTALNIRVVIKINNRKILSGIAEVIGEREKIVDITVAIDKLDKIGVDGVNKELREKQISETAIEKLQPLIAFTGNYEEKIALLENLISASEIGKKGIEETRFIFDTVASLGLRTAGIELDITLARGLNYYTGAIFEVKANEGTLTSSITGGGRYDDLTGIFGLPNLSGVGISFGADRIYDVLNELNKWPESVAASTRLLFVNFGGEDELHCLKLLRDIRNAGVSAELYPDAAKMAKQMKYADAKKIPFVALIGANERAAGTVTLKDMRSGEQAAIPQSELIQKITA